MAGLKKHIAVLVCSLFVTAGAVTGAGFTFREVKKHGENADNIKSEFLVSPELTSNVSDDVISILKQDNDNKMIFSLMRKFAPETYKRYTNEEDKAEFIGKAGAIEALAAITGIAVATKKSLDIKKVRDRKRYNKIGATAEERKVDTNGNVTVKKSDVRKVNTNGDIIKQ